MFGFRKPKEFMNSKELEGSKKTFLDKVKDVLVLYDDLYFSSMVKNSSVFARRSEKDSTKLTIDFIGSYDGENVTFYYMVDRLPRELYIDFKDRLRRECKHGVKITFLNLLKQHKIEWESAHMRSRLRILKQAGDDNNKEEIDAYSIHKNIDSLSRQSWLEESLQYLATADRQRGRALLKSALLVVVSGKRGVVFDDSVKMIENCASHIGIRLERVLYEIPDFLKHHSPFSRAYSKHIDSITPTNVLPDELVSRYNSYTQGTLGVEGVYFGTDVYSRFPVLKKVKPKEDFAENWLITAETGGGKSFVVKALILQLLGLGYKGTIMDIEGFEYTPLANFMSHNSSVQIINMGEGDGRYFDPMEIADVTGIRDIDRDAKNMSINFTTAIFKVLLGKAYAVNIWLDTVINDAVSGVYKKAGVTEDRSSWCLSVGLSLFDVYDMLKNLGDKRKDENYKSAVEQAIAVTSRYFEPDGTRSSIFKEKVNVRDIISADLIVCSFGMAGKAPQSVDEIQLALMQLGAAQLSHQRSIFSKSQGKFNFKVWEEFQRWGKFPDSDKTLGVAVTGGRKLGDVNIIITNVVKELLDDDRFGVLSNITSFMIGAVGDDKVRADLCDRLSIDNMKNELDYISAAQRVEDDRKSSKKQGNTESPFAYAFLCGLDKSKFAVTKMVIPLELRKSKLFKTGVDLAGGGGV